MTKCEVIFARALRSNRIRRKSIQLLAAMTLLVITLILLRKKSNFWISHRCCLWPPLPTGPFGPVQKEHWRQQRPGDRNGIPADYGPCVGCAGSLFFAGTEKRLKKIGHGHTNIFSADLAKKIQASLFGGEDVQTSLVSARCLFPE